MAVARCGVDHRHGRDRLQRLLQALAAARDDQVDGVLLGRQLGQLLAPTAGHERHAALGEPGGDGRLGGDLGQRRVGVHGRGGTAQDDRVARLQAQRRRVDRHVRTRLVDDRDHAERDAHLAHVQAVRQALPVDHLADRVGERGDLPDGAARSPRSAAVVEAQAVEQRLADLAPRGRPACRARWPSRISSTPALQRDRDRLQRGVLDGGVRLRKRARRALGGAAGIGDGRGGGGHRPKGTTVSRARGSRGARPPRSRAAGSRGPRRTSGRAPRAARRPSSCRCPCRASAPARPRRRDRRDLDGVARVEVAAHVDDPDGQQAGAALAHARAAPASIRSVPREGLAYFSHSLKRAVARLARGEARALALAGEHRLQRLGTQAVADHRGDARGASPCRPRRPSSASRPSPAARSCVRSRARPARRSRSTSPTIRASGYRRGSAVKRPSMSVSRISSRRRPAPPPGPRGSRCRRRRSHRWRSCRSR